MRFRYPKKLNLFLIPFHIGNEITRLSALASLFYKHPALLPTVSNHLQFILDYDRPHHNVNNSTQINQEQRHQKQDKVVTDLVLSQWVSNIIGEERREIQNNQQSDFIEYLQVLKFSIFEGFEVQIVTQVYDCQDDTEQGSNDRSLRLVNFHIFIAVCLR
jgi:hypothetical protein